MFVSVGGGGGVVVGGGVVSGGVVVGVSVFVCFFVVMMVGKLIDFVLSLFGVLK